MRPQKHYFQWHFRASNSAITKARFALSRYEGFGLRGGGGGIDVLVEVQHNVGFPKQSLITTQVWTFVLHLAFASGDLLAP